MKTKNKIKKKGNTHWLFFAKLNKLINFDFLSMELAHLALPHPRLNVLKYVLLFLRNSFQTISVNSENLIIKSNHPP
jgi:hypothetical protein